MALHIIKLCVGCDTVEELLDWRREQGEEGGPWILHTRMTPKRAEEVLDGGSLYRVFKGFILCRSIAGEAEILTLAVDPARRRRGAGRALVEAAAGMAATLGAEEMFLEVAVDNPAALALYEAAGFARVGRRPGYYARTDGADVDAVVMRRELNSRRDSPYP